MATIAIDVAETIRTHCATPLYAFNSERGMTFTELLMAVSVERAMTMEAISVTKMSTLTKKNVQLQAYTACVEALNKNLAVNQYSALDTVRFNLPSEFVSKKGHTYEGNQTSVADFLEYELGVTTLTVDSIRGLSNNVISTRSTSLKAVDYLTAYGILKNEMDSINTTSDEDLIDIQTYVNCRDTAYNLATNSVKNVMKNTFKVANNF